MLIRKWKIRIQSDGRPAITFPSGRQDGGVIVIYCLFFASVIIISAKQFSNEKDSNKIYAVSSIIIALISCIISTVAFVMQFFM